MSSRVIPMAAAAVRYGTSDMAFEWEPQPEHVTVKRSKMLEGFGSNLGYVLGSESHYGYLKSSSDKCLYYRYLLLDLTCFYLVGSVDIVWDLYVLVIDSLPKYHHGLESYHYQSFIYQVTNYQFSIVHEDHDSS